MSIPDYDNLALTQAQAINDLLPQLSIKGVLSTVTVRKTIHSGVTTYSSLPLIYAVTLTSVPTMRGTRLVELVLDLEQYLVTSVLQSDVATDDGSQAIQDANAAKYVLLNHYAQRPFWHVSAALDTPLLYLREASQIISLSATSFTKDFQNPSPQYAGVRMVQRLIFGAPII
jgi:hypothetical protein